jgi:tetratricopeptide (TPR) repeat protein
MAGSIDKTVFISYRRTNSFMARAVYQSLTAKGYDVFFDFEGVNSGDFEQIILGNLRARAHFLVILTPSALERCNEPGDWLRREIETAIDEKRNIVPLFFEGFNFSTPSIAQYMVGRMALLKNYNGLNVPADYFNEAIDRLINRYLNVPLDGVIHPLSKGARKGAAVQKAAIGKTDQVTDNELAAENWFEQGYKHGEAKDYDEAIRCYSEAIQLKPEYPAAYYNRGVNYGEKGNFEEAVRDYTEAIGQNPGYVDAYYNRGVNRSKLDDFDGAIRDYTEAVRLKPDFATAFYNRGVNWGKKGDFDNAIKDYMAAIRLLPDYVDAFNNLGDAYFNKGDYDLAIKNFEKALQFNPDYAIARTNLKIARAKKK